VVAKVTLFVTIAFVRKNRLARSSFGLASTVRFRLSRYGLHEPRRWCLHQYTSDIRIRMGSPLLLLFLRASSRVLWAMDQAITLSFVRFDFSIISYMVDTIRIRCAIWRPERYKQAWMCYHHVRVAQNNGTFPLTEKVLVRRKPTLSLSHKSASYSEDQNTIPRLTLYIKPDR